MEFIIIDNDAFAANDVVLTAIRVPEPASLASWSIIAATLSLLAVRRKRCD